MPSPTTVSQICRLAASLFGEPISNIETPVSDAERLCSYWYDLSRQACLRLGVWNFANRRIVCHRDSEDPTLGYPDAYNLPNNFIRLRFIGDDYENTMRRDYELESGQILIDNGGEGSIEIGYVADEANVAKFDPLFKHFLVLTLALNISGGLKKQVNSNTYKILTDWKGTMESVAKSVDGQERPPVKRDTSKFRTRRMGASDISQDNRYVSIS